MKIPINIFDYKSIERAVERTVKAEARVQQAIDLAIEDLMNFAKAHIESELAYQGLGDSRYAQSIRVVRINNGFSIMSGAEHVLFIEFGTGVEGANSPHPNMGAIYDGDWEYDSNNHGYAGWWYPTTENDPNPTRKRTKDGAWVAWTRGAKSRPVMYNTWLYIRRIGVSVFNKHLRRV